MSKAVVSQIMKNEMNLKPFKHFAVNFVVVVFQVIWLVLRFFLLATEISVVVFGLAFG